MKGVERNGARNGHTDTALESALPLWMDIQLSMIGVLQRMFRKIPGLSLLDYPLRYASVIGSGIPAMAQSVIVLWMIDPAGGIIVGRILVFNIFTVGLVKSFVLGLRPYKCSVTRIEHLDPNNEVSGGFPSGHTSSLTSLFLGYMQGVVLWKEIMDIFTVTQLTSLGIGLVVFVALSRVYTAAHFFHDLAGGFAISFTLDRFFDYFNLLDRHSDSLVTCNMLLIGLVSIGLGRLALRVQSNGKVLTELIFEIIFGTAAALGLLFVQSYLYFQGHSSLAGPLLDQWEAVQSPVVSFIRVAFGGAGLLGLFTLGQKITGVQKHSIQATWLQLLTFDIFFATAVFWAYVVIMELTTFHNLGS